MKIVGAIKCSQIYFEKQNSLLGAFQNLTFKPDQKQIELFGFLFIELRFEKEDSGKKHIKVFLESNESDRVTFFDDDIDVDRIRDTTNTGINIRINLALPKKINVEIEKEYNFWMIIDEEDKKFVTDLAFTPE